MSDRPTLVRFVNDRNSRSKNVWVALPPTPTNDPGQMTWHATKTYAKPHATTVKAAPVA